MSDRPHADLAVWASVAFLVLLVHVIAPGLHAVNADYWIGFTSGLTLGFVIGLVVDRVVLVPSVDFFERRRHGG